MIAQANSVTSTGADGTVSETTIALELKAGLSIRELEKRIAQANRAGDIGARALAFYLTDMAERGAHQQLGFRSVEQFAETRFGIRPSTIRAYLAVGRALEDLPQLDEAFCAAKLFWSQVRLLARVATPETEAAWVKWARRRSIREIAAHVRRREKGDLPTDPAKRQIHTTTFTVQGRLNAVGLETWNAARAKLEAETGTHVTDADLMLHAARLLLDTRADGSVPGRSPVNDSHYRVVLHCHEGGGPVEIHTEDGPVALDNRTAREALIEAGREDLAETLDEELGDENENTGPEVPPEERDDPTPPAMRAEVLARDGYRCLCCRVQLKPSGHHKLWRRYGGPTEPANLMTLCTGCHSLVHDRLLIVHGRIPDQLRFTDARGRDLRELGDTIEAALATVRRDTRVSTERPMEFASLPGRVDADWWACHNHLLDWKDARGTLEFSPGVPRPPQPPGPGDEARTEEVGTRVPRPQRLDDVIGQSRAVAHIRRAVARARYEAAPVRHILLYGPAGLGKTTLARIVAREMGTACRQVSGPVVKEVGALLGLLTSLAKGDVLFIDEIHGLPIRVAEFLYEAMEDGVVSLPVSCGMQRRTLRVRLRPFTVVGATTDLDLLPPSFRGRFPLREQLEFYEAEDVAVILRRAAAQAGHELAADAAHRLASVSRDTPREGLALLESVLDEAVPAGERRMDAKLVADVLASLEIDDRGLLPLDRRYLEVLDREGRPVGRTTLARRLGVTGAALQELHEPYLIRRGFVRITPLGRELAGPRRAPNRFRDRDPSTPAG